MVSILDKIKKSRKDEKTTVSDEQVEVKVANIPVKKDDKKVVVKKAVTKVVPKPSKEDTGDAYKILVKPILTEKVTDLALLNKYAFEVATSTNKNEVKK